MGFIGFIGFVGFIGSAGAGLGNLVGRDSGNPHP